MRNFNSKGFAAIVSVLLTSVMALTLTACNIDAPGTTEYVDSVRQDMLQAVNLTRKLKEQQKKLDARSIDDATKNMETLDQLDNIYSDLIKLESPSKYDDLNDDIKKNAKSALAYTKEVKSLVSAAMNTGNDSLYKQDNKHIMEQYEENYTALVDLSSQVTTRYRNN